MGSMIIYISALLLFLTPIASAQNKAFIHSDRIDINDDVHGLVTSRGLPDDLDIYTILPNFNYTSDNRIQLTMAELTRGSSGQSEDRGKRGYVEYSLGKNHTYSFSRYLPTRDIIIQDFSLGGELGVRGSSKPLNSVKLDTIEVVDMSTDKHIDRIAIENIANNSWLENPTKFAINNNLQIFSLHVNDKTAYSASIRDLPSLIISHSKNGKHWDQSSANSIYHNYTIAGWLSSLIATNSHVVASLVAQGGRYTTEILVFSIQADGKLNLIKKLSDANGNYKYYYEGIYLDGQNLFIGARNQTNDERPVLHFELDSNSAKHRNTIPTKLNNSITRIIKNGDYLLVGSPYSKGDDGLKVGMVHVLKQNGASWSMIQDIRLDPGKWPNSSAFGQNFEIDNNGNLIVASKELSKLPFDDLTIKKRVLHIFKPIDPHARQLTPISNIDTPEIVDENITPDIPVIVGPSGNLPKKSPYADGRHWYKWKKSSHATKYKIEVYREGITYKPNQVRHHGDGIILTWERNSDKVCTFTHCYTGSGYPRWDLLGGNKCERGWWAVYAGNNSGWSKRSEKVSVCGSPP